MCNTTQYHRLLLENIALERQIMIDKGLLLKDKHSHPQRITITPNDKVRPSTAEIMGDHHQRMRKEKQHLI